MVAIALGSQAAIQISGSHGCHGPRISVADPDKGIPWEHIALGFLWLIQIVISQIMKHLQ